SNRISEAMMAQIVAALICIRARLCRVDQGKAKHVVGRFVPPILTVVQDCRAKSAAIVGYISPLLRRHFVMIRCVIAASNSAKPQVISSFWIRGGKRKGRLQQTVRRFPIHCILDVDAITAVNKHYSLNEG